jgi:hypothetical protein
MGLDTYIYDTDRNEIGYFRKFQKFCDYWVDFARKNYPELANKMPESWDGLDREYWEKKITEGDYNCVNIPVRTDDWDECVKHFLNLYTEERYSLSVTEFAHYVELIDRVDSSLILNGYWSNNEFIYVTNWW